MIDPSVLNSDLLGVLLGGIATLITHYKKKNEKEARLVALIVSLVLGALWIILTDFYGFDTVWSALLVILDKVIKVLSISSLIWAMFLRTKYLTDTKEVLNSILAFLRIRKVD